MKYPVGIPAKTPELRLMVASFSPCRKIRCRPSVILLVFFYYFLIHLSFILLFDTVQHILLMLNKHVNQ